MLVHPTSDSPKRRPPPKVNTAIRLAGDDLGRLDSYISGQRHPTTRTVVIEEAIRGILDRGYAVEVGAHTHQRNRPAKLSTAVRLPSDLLAKLHSFVESLPPPTTRTLVIEEAIRAFLDREGA